MTMKFLAAFLAVTGSSALAEVVKTDTYQLNADRRAVALKGNQSGGTLSAEQVIVTVTRLDGQAVNVASAQPIAAKLACRGAKPMVAFPSSAPTGAQAFEFLCKKG